MNGLAAALGRAETLNAIGRSAQARELLLEQAQDGRENPDWLLALARTECLLERFDQAGQLAEEALRYAPERAEPFLLRGRIAIERDDPEAALADANRAVELEPELPAGHLLAARALLETAPRGEAVERAIDTAERLGAGPSHIAMLRGVLWALRGELPRAREYTAAGLAQDPTDPDLRRLAASLTTRDTKGAAETGRLLRGLLAEAPTDAQARLQLATAYTARIQLTLPVPLVVFLGASAALMLPPVTAAVCAIGGLALLAFFFRRCIRRAVEVAGAEEHRRLRRAFPELVANRLLMLVASAAPLVPLATKPFLSGPGDPPGLAVVAAASALVGVCCAWPGQRLGEHGRLRLLQDAATGERLDAQQLHRLRAQSFFTDTVVLRRILVGLAIGAAMFAQLLPPGLGMIAMFTAPCAWLCSWSLHGMLVRERLHQRRGTTPVLTFRYALLPGAQILIAVLMMLVWSGFCIACFVGGVAAFTNG